MKITKQDMLNLWNSFERMHDQKKNVLFSYFIAKNRISLQPEIDAIKEAQKPPEAFVVFEEKRVQLAQSMANKIEGTDEPLIEGNQYVIKENLDEFTKKMSELKESFKTVISDRENQIEGLNKLLKDDIEFTGYKIKLQNLPPDIEPSIVEYFLKADLITEE